MSSTSILIVLVAILAVFVVVDAQWGYGGPYGGGYYGGGPYGGYGPYGGGFRRSFYGPRYGGYGPYGGGYGGPYGGYYGK
ncbi:unnamed protein product [Caenorhabditis angaria]|uniref:Uncharacterized protein n=1 Tax=Caenorhabditis angaria TaxID=860376 RepID=A0A9P1N869_9PELO|nr:unnamed protein product [Caenorhabditis angaria]